MTFRPNVTFAWYQQAGGVKSVTFVWWKTYTLIYPDPLFCPRVLDEEKGFYDVNDRMDDDEELKAQCYGGEYMSEVFDHLLKRMSFRKQVGFSSSGKLALVLAMEPLPKGMAQYS
jgi:hypothetical protein